MGARAEKKDRGQKRDGEIQVFLITTAEKTATKRKMEERGLKIEKINPLLRRFFWFCIFQIIILWSASGRVCTCECLNVCMHSA